MQDLWNGKTNFAEDYALLEHFRNQVNEEFESEHDSNEKRIQIEGADVGIDDVVIPYELGIFSKDFLGMYSYLNC
jgi:hypothetical protein